jgi:hypothetical protein
MSRTKDWLSDVLHREPKEIDEKIKKVCLERSWEIKRQGKGKFREEYLPGWYEIAREAHKFLTGEQPLPANVERRDLYHVTKTLRDVEEDNLTPIRTLGLNSINYALDSPIKAGPLNMTLHFNGYTMLDNGSTVEVTPLSRFKTPQESKKFTKAVEIPRYSLMSTSVDPEPNLEPNRVDDIGWSIDYRILKEAFGDKDYDGSLIEPGQTSWLRVKIRRKDPSEIAYHGIPQRMA